MAENNSKKPMALLLLVVVGVLVVLYFAGGNSDCNKVTTAAVCSDATATDKDACEAIADATWTADVTEKVEADNADDCKTAGGTWTGEEAPATDPPATDPPATDSPATDPPTGK